MTQYSEIIFVIVYKHLNAVWNSLATFNFECHSVV